MENTISRFDELDLLCKQLISKIASDKYKQEHTKLKKELYTAKLEMINILDTEKETSGITARELIENTKNRKKVARYSIGMLDDEFRGGIEVGTFIQLAGQSFVGKTHFILEVMANISGYAECVLFNFEMGETRMAYRLNDRLITDTQLDNLIIDSHTRDIDDLVNEIRIYAKKGIVFFCIDSKMKITSSQGDDFKRYNEISSKLARVCQENDIIVLLVNQMSNGDIKDSNFAFKGSGDQLYDADIALFYTIDVDKKDEIRMLTCTKNRQDEITFSRVVTLVEGSTKLIFTKRKK